MPTGRTTPRFLCGVGFDQQQFSKIVNNEIRSFPAITHHQSHWMDSTITIVAMLDMMRRKIGKVRKKNLFNDLKNKSQNEWMALHWWLHPHLMSYKPKT